MLNRVLPLVFLAAVVGAGLAVPPPPTAGETGVVKIVSSLPRSGSARGQSDTIVDGIRLAIAEVGGKVTIAGKEYRIEYQDLDDATAAAGQWTAEQEIANANLAKTDPDVMAYIGTYNSGAAKMSMPILNKARLLMISPANTSPGLTKPGTGDRDEPIKRYRPTGEVNYIRVVPTDDLQGPAGAVWAKSMGMKNVYILDDNEVYGKGVADLFESHARKIGLNVLGRESIDFKAQEFSGLMTKIKSKQPDLIYFGGTTQTKAGQLAKDMVKAGMDRCKMMGPDGCYEEAMIASAGADILNNRFFVTFGGLPPDKLTDYPKGREFVANYTAKHGRPPSEAYALYGYECGRVAIEALRTAEKKDRDAVRRAGIAIKDFPGVTGPFSFDENGDTTSAVMSGLVVQNGKFVFSKALTVDTK
jgi:branched-chain amino acid transport system substrate-binding protein